MNSETWFLFFSSLVSLPLSGLLPLLVLLKMCRYLGLSVGCVVHSMDKKTKARNYNADVTFVTSLCLGWDHLWDGIAENRTELVMNPEDSDWKSVFNYAIVDEVGTGEEKNLSPPPPLDFLRRVRGSQ